MISVLIETYWNVNENGLESHSKKEKVLIETYWNVNQAELDRLKAQKEY